ncbi:phosphoenolpyruvate--protein phosphotransferase [Saccharococcus caldoxylosilyticus]|jgi:phosphoenolpyruvate-protein phosphotransferase (PTS system enzyme I)|uniref:Phosphoenolpyruvate-protein phosphotransferase n=1 Tax=Parageobacillus caldoxylosilyticus NBRC 107762 TaxID=1220594 RepID=A0A023DC03_9BACL|nr:phosphoenolpyruvate--protein phosphotransferase [Parageobacillus caldoxylosilyticus]OQP03222.1 phosphoenolpyruvate--protein phosphotransferase [Geobacillus sp. 44B]MBB3851769.1 phosphotransferase system enzyme I (PtsI) [Parageobacillus caldoxylosilyticus]QNU37963.1 phosphoenolpyruvate--protein phosphotransferase [Geobacillus sp. 44B]QXJ37593.1 Phosphoenolpyruvate-protein phosphotransferase [Parageobacillus caldoxylosilyticus]BDG34943.1 phosphoenolpyruvate-protein phosphotransferase [Parageo
MTKTIQGIAASSGIAIAKAYRLETPNLVVEKKEIVDPQTEVARFETAVAQAKEELEAIKRHALKQLGEDKAAIFAAHLLVLDDPELLNPVKEKIQTEKVNAEYALHETASMFISMFEAMDNEYMKERAADIRDVTKRVLAHLLGVAISNPSLIAEEVIIVAEDLTPSDTAQLNRQYVKGFATDVGGRTSHSAIMARSMEIPAVVGTKQVTAEVQNGDIVIIDGLDGQVVVNPTPDVLAHYEEKRARYEAQRAEWAKLVHEKTVTSDGYHVELAANIGTPDDVKGVLENGAEGIGLYRTEFLYMGRSELPTEEEQFEAYKTVLERMEGKPVVVRTLDIGGDKELPYLDLPKEMNPFLGFRAIRLCLEMQDMFRTQLRALLRASVYGNLKIMFPMIATLDEFRQAKSILLEEKEKLEREGVPVADDIEVGMMVEIPAAAVLADQFAKEVDFFSIGTNDLIQYTMAADRMNERVSYLYQPYNPAILRLISNVIDAAHKEGKWAGMCGEMAGDAIAIPILLGLGLDEFSMSATSILRARAQMKKLSKEEAARFKETVLSMNTAEEVVAFVKQTFHIE